MRVATRWVPWATRRIESASVSLSEGRLKPPDSVGTASSLVVHFVPRTRTSASTFYFYPCLSSRAAKGARREENGSGKPSLTTRTRQKHFSPRPLYHSVRTSSRPSRFEAARRLAIHRSRLRRTIRTVSSRVSLEISSPPRRALYRRKGKYVTDRIGERFLGMRLKKECFIM